MAEPDFQEQRKQTAAALSLLQRLPPQDLETNLGRFTKIAPHLEKSLEPYVTRPLQVKRDPEQNRWFIACEYNFDGGTHRSPWSNKYIPPPAKGDEEGLWKPSDRHRRLEETFNEVFDVYKTSYYEGGVSSVYLWELEEGFAGAFLIRKEMKEGKDVDKGVWDSVHVLEVRELANSNFAEYKLSSTVRIHVEVGDVGTTGETEVGGLVSRQAESRRDIRKKSEARRDEDVHLLHMGRMIEEMEISIRQSLESFYMAKQRDILDKVRHSYPDSLEEKSDKDQEEDEEEAAPK